LRLCRQFSTHTCSVVCLLSLTCFSRCSYFFFLHIPPPPRSTLFPYTTLFRSSKALLKECRHKLAYRGLTSLEVEGRIPKAGSSRSEEHTSELQSRVDLVCRLLLEKKKN